MSERFKFGERVRYPGSENGDHAFSGIYRGKDHHGHAMVERDDGINGSGPNGEWTLPAEWLEPGLRPAPEAPATVEYPAEFKPLLDAVIAAASAKRELESFDGTRQKLYKANSRAADHLAQELARAAKL
jgi:hypothetical protein